MNDVLFYSGLIIVLATLIPNLRLGMKMRSQRAEYARFPQKLEELKANYRTRRWRILLIQMLGIAISILALYL